MKLSYKIIGGLFLAIFIIALIAFYRGQAHQALQQKAKVEVALADMTAQRDALEVINTANAVVAKLNQRAMSVNQGIAKSVSSGIAKDRAEAVAVRNAVRSEGEKDESVEAYLRTPVPDSIRSVLNSTQGSFGDSSGISMPASGSVIAATYREGAGVDFGESGSDLGAFQSAGAAQCMWQEDRWPERVV